jgi:hypothetical protein
MRTSLAKTTHNTILLLSQVKIIGLHESIFSGAQRVRFMVLLGWVIIQALNFLPTWLE